MRAGVVDDGLEVAFMGSLGTTQLMALLLVVATIAALGGFSAAVVTRRRKRRTRKVFLVGVVCGVLAGQIVRGRRRGLRTLTVGAHRDRHLRRRRSRGRLDTRALISRAVRLSLLRV